MMQWIQVVRKYAYGNNYNLLPYGGGFESHVELVNHVIFFGYENYNITTWILWFRTIQNNKLMKSDGGV
jgi:hypothetical protein